MKVKKKILFLFRFKFHLLFLKSVIDQLLRSPNYRIYFSIYSESLLDITRKTFPTSKVTIITGYNMVDIKRIQPDLVICLEIWLSQGVVPLLTAVKEQNIPVLMYNHGTLPFKSRYLVEKDEYKNAFRSNLALCSHVACWGELGLENWVSFGVLKEKMYLTGALQYDELYILKIDIQRIYKALDIASSKKIILYFTSIGHPTIDDHMLKRDRAVLKALERFVATQKEFKLVVKPHPLAMVVQKGPFAHAESTLLISNPLEDAWEGMPRIDINHVIAASYAVVSVVSSVLIAPMILGKPIIHVELESGGSKDFSHLGSCVFFNLSKGKRIGNLIKAIEIEHDEQRRIRLSKLAALYNYNNDGLATRRFISLVEEILNGKARGKNFYLQEQEEYLECLKRFPYLPYPYQNLIVYYGRKGDLAEADKWMTEYIGRFSEPRQILRKLCGFYRKARTPMEEERVFLEKYNRQNILDTWSMFRLGILNRMTGRFTESISLFKILLNRQKMKSDKKKLVYELGLSYLLDDQLDAAIDCFLDLLKKSAGLGEMAYRIYFRLGEAYFKKKVYSKASVYLKKCLKLCPGHNAAGELLKVLKGKG